MEWLCKTELLLPEAFWFYGQFVSTLWCLWIHKNECIFNNISSNPIKVIFYQKAIYQWIYQASQEQAHDLSINNTNIQRQRQNQYQFQNIHPYNGNNLVYSDHWLLFIDIRKKMGKNWFDSSSIIKSPSGFSITLCKSFTIESKRHAKLLILRKVLLRIQEFQVARICCRDHKEEWQKLWNPSTIVNWLLFPAFADIISLSSSV